MRANHDKGCPINNIPINRLVILMLDSNMIVNQAGLYKVLYVVVVDLVESHTKPKTSMWCVGSCRIPHVGQNTNASIESYHSNFKNIIHLAK